MDNVLQTLQRDGYVVIEDFFCPEGIMDSLKENLMQLNPDLRKSWTKYNLPLQAHLGMFQRLCSNFPALWQLRHNKALADVFRYLYGTQQSAPLISSIDAFTLLPPGEYPDTQWIHTDQTICGLDRSIQSQLVVSRSPTCYFEVCPRSHILHDSIIERYCLQPNSIFFKIPKEDYSTLKAQVEQLGGAWQVKVNPPPGSLILWYSSTLHASRFGKGAPDDPWRCSVYISMHPEEDTYMRGDLSEIILNNGSTYHWGDTVIPLPRYYRDSDYNPNIARLMRHPKLVYNLIGYQPSPNAYLIC